MTGSDSVWKAVGYGLPGDTDRSEFHFSESLTIDDLTELLERNPRMSMMCEWIPGEALKNGWRWVKDEQITYVDEDGVTQTVSKDDYLQIIHAHEKIRRATTFMRLHGVSACVFFNDSPELDEASEDGTYRDFEVYHLSNTGTGWFIQKDDLDPEDNIQTITIRVYPPVDEPALITQLHPKEFKVNADRIVFFRNPMIRTRWRGTPSSRKIAHVALIEELLLKYLSKHALNVVNSFMWFKGVKSQTEADALHTAYNRQPLIDFFTRDVEMVPMHVNSGGADFKAMFDILKDYLAAAMNVSRQMLDGAPEGTLSSAQYNTRIGYGVIHQLQAHITPYLEKVFRKLGFRSPEIEWPEPLESLELTENEDKAENKEKEKGDDKE